MNHLHVFFLPFLSPGNMIPMVDLAKLFARRGARATIVTTASNASRIEPTLDRSCPHPIRALTIPFPPSLPDDLSSMPAPAASREFLDAIGSLEGPFGELLEEHRPDCVVSDQCYAWSVDLAAARGIPAVIFRGGSVFSGVVGAAIARLKPHEGLAADGETFAVPGIPHRIEMRRSQVQSTEDPSSRVMADWFLQIAGACSRSFGVVHNSSYELEPGYARVFGNRTWLVGPVSLCNSETPDRAARGGGAGHDASDCLRWLEEKKEEAAGSVLYVSFGSMARFSCAQLREIAGGLEASGHPFVWVVGNAEEGGLTSEWMPEGFEERVVGGGGKGAVLSGWAPQMVMLNHAAVGGFMTHCGWNSCLEGASCGLPMVTWPLASDQFCNERLVVDVLRIGVAVGSKKCSWRAEGRTLVSAEEVKEAVKDVMGGGEEAGERRKRARDVAELARKAMEEGGSSYNAMDSLIQELIDVKLKKANKV